MLALNHLLQVGGFNPTEVAVILHTPGEPKLRAALPWIVQARRTAFEEYQRAHSKFATATLRRRPVAASFVGLPRGGLVFVGMYRRIGVTDRRIDDIRADPEHRFLQNGFGYIGASNDTHPYFDFRLLDEMADLSGRLVIKPILSRSYVRLAENLNAPVTEISRESQFDPTPPPWREWLISGPMMRTLPDSWADRLREWRGIYLILDESDGARYVGSAYGAENLLGRWLAHVAQDRGVTVQLRHRDPVNFQFSILERVSPDMPPEEVIALEHTWMARLGTRTYGLNA